MLVSLPHSQPRNNGLPNFPIWNMGPGVRWGYVGPKDGMVVNNRGVKSKVGQQSWVECLHIIQGPELE